MKKEDFIIGEMITVYTDTCNEWFGVGIVLAVDDAFVLLKSISTLGEDDGLTLYRIEEIVKIETNTMYCQKLKKLMRIKNVVLLNYDIPKNEYLAWIIKKSLEENSIIDVQLLSSQHRDIVGIVKDINDGNCIILQIDDLGRKDGECQFLLESISSIKFNSVENRTLQLLVE